MTNGRKVGHHRRGDEIVDIFKNKPETLNVRAIGGFDLHDVKTGELIQSVEAENLKKDGILDFARDTVYRYLSFRNTNTDLPNSGDNTTEDSARGYAINRMLLINDPSNNETSKASLNDGTIVGWADLGNDYGGADQDRGSRNKSRSYAFYDPASDELVVRIAAIFDETRLNGNTVNKLALAVVNNNREWATGRGYRLLNNNNKDLDWTFRMTDVFTGVWEDTTYYYRYASHVRAYRQYLFHHERDNPGRIKVLDLSRQDSSGTMGTEAVTSLRLVQDVLDLESITLWSRVTDDAVYLADIVGNKVKLLKFTLSVPMTEAPDTVQCTDYEVMTLDIESPDTISGLSFHIDGGQSRVFYNHNSTLHYSVFDIANGIVSETVDIGANFMVNAVAHVRDDLYIVKIVPNANHASTFNTTLGYLDMSTNRYLGVMASGNKPYFNEHNAWLYSPNNKTLYAWYPIDYAAPATIIHMDSLVPITKDSTQQLTARYEIRIGKDFAAIADPFDSFDSFEDGTAIVVRDANFVPEVGRRTLSGLVDINKPPFKLREGATIAPSSSTAYLQLKREGNSLFIKTNSSSPNLCGLAVLDDMDFSEGLSFSMGASKRSNPDGASKRLYITAAALATLVDGDDFTQHRAGSWYNNAYNSDVWYILPDFDTSMINTKYALEAVNPSPGSHIYDAIKQPLAPKVLKLPKVNGYFSVMARIIYSYADDRYYLLVGLMGYSNSYKSYSGIREDITDIFEGRVSRPPRHTPAGELIESGYHIVQTLSLIGDGFPGFTANRRYTDNASHINNDTNGTITIEVPKSNKYKDIVTLSLVQEDYLPEDADKITVTSVTRIDNDDNTNLRLKVVFDNASGKEGWGIAGTAILRNSCDFLGWTTTKYANATIPLAANIGDDSAVYIEVANNDAAHDIELTLSHCGDLNKNTFDSKPITISVPAK